MLEHDLADILFNRSPMRMAVVSVPGFRYEMANAAETAFYRSLGVTDFMGLTWAEIWKDKLPPKFLAFLDEVAATGSPNRIVDEPLEAVIEGTPRVIYASFEYFPIRGKTGAVEHILWAGRDTEELLRAQRAAREEAEQRAADWKAVFEAAGEGFRVFDETGRTVAINAVALKSAGADSIDSPQALRVAHPTQKFFRWDGRPLRRDELPSARALRGDYVHDFPLKLVNAKGEAHYLLSSTAPLKTPEGQPRRFLLSIRDETALQKAKDRQAFLLELSDALRSLSDAKAIQDTATRLLRDHLHVSQASYSEHTEGSIVINSKHLNDAKSTVAGTHTRGDFPASVAILRTGRHLVIPDALSFPECSKEESARLVALNIRASISIPLVKEGGLVAVLTVRQFTPREWTPEEVELVRETAERTWAAVERAKAEEALEEHEALTVRAIAAERQRLYDVLETLPVMVCLISPDYRIVFANRTFRDRYGESTGRRCHECCAGYSEPCSFCESLMPLKTGQPHHWEFRNRGTVIDAYDYPFSDTDGSPLILEMDIDITDRRKAEDAVAAERTWLLALLDSMTDEVWFADAEGKVFLMNDRPLDNLGFTDLKEVQGRSVIDIAKEVDILGPDGAPRRTEQTPLMRSLRGEVITGELEIVRNKKTGEYRYREVSSSPVREESGHIIGAVAVDRDMTEARKIQMDSLSRAAEWNALIEASPDAIYLTDENGAVLEANPAWYRSSGFEPGTPVPGALDQPRLIVTMPDGSPIAVSDRPTARALRGEKVANFQYRVVNVKGQEHHFLQNTTSIETPHGKRSLSIVTDITELKRLERLKDEFMLVVGHELRNPLQVILGRLQLLEMKFDRNSFKEYGADLESLKTQAHLLRSIVEDLLNAYRVGNGRLSVNLIRTDFKQVVANALEPYLTEPYHRWSFSLPRTPVEVMADPLRLRQAVTNLLTNSQKYTPAGKAIRVNLSSRKGSALLRVEDEGTGIPPEDLEKVFDGFYRTPDVAKWQPGSVGLGLYISRGLVRRMGGDLWAENREGGGTVMCLKMRPVK